VWVDQQTGSYGYQTYQGKPSSLVHAMPHVTAMAYWNKRIYYTLEGSSRLYWRWFNPESGIVGDRVWGVSGVNSTHTTGMFAQRGRLYVVSSGGKVRAHKIAGAHVAATGARVAGATDWAPGLVFAGPGPLPPKS
jgi:hypothetical protein